MKHNFSCLSFAVLLAVAGAGASGYRVLNKVAIPGTGSWDYVTVDGANRRVYVSHETRVDVLDADTQKIVGTMVAAPGRRLLILLDSHDNS